MGGQAFNKRLVKGRKKKEGGNGGPATWVEGGGPSLVKIQ